MICTGMVTMVNTHPVFSEYFIGSIPYGGRNASIIPRPEPYPYERVGRLYSIPKLRLDM